MFRLIKWTGWFLFSVFFKSPDDNAPWKLTSHLTVTGFPLSKYAITSSLVILFFNLSKTSISWGPHLNFTSFHVNSLNGAVRVEYLGMNLDRYGVIPRKLLTASLDSGGLQSFTARILSGLSFKPSIVKR